MFEVCCNKRNEVKYEILHSPKPLKTTEELKLSLEWLLWYSPHINSIQSTKNELIKEPIYDDIIFNIITESMGLSINDIKIVEKSIDNKLYNYFRRSICNTCQKLIFTRNSKKTKSEELLRHIRNIIAHGNFTMIDDLLIGFDISKSDNTAILKIKPVMLYEAIKKLDSGITKEKIWKYLFKKNGYIVNDNIYERSIFDIKAEKNNITFLIEIKENVKYGWIRVESIKRLIENANNINNNYRLVLIIDKGKLTNEAKSLLNKNKIIVLDQNLIKKFANGEDILSKYTDSIIY